MPAAATPASARLFVADIDNNGALDVLATASRAGTGVWLAGAGGALQPYSQPVDAELWSVVDLNGDGQLDLVGLAAGRPVRCAAKERSAITISPSGRGRRPSPAISASTRSASAGKSKSDPDVFVQKQMISGTTVHFGLGTRTSVDVTRIVWPNGVPQAEFDPAVDRPIVAQQRLKGSCPWVFADNGSGHAVRDRLPVAIAARAPHQRAGHGRRHADRGLGEDSRRPARSAQTAPTTSASPPNCGKRTSSITCR